MEKYFHSEERIKGIKAIFTLFILLAILSMNSYAGNVNFTATTSKNPVSVGERFQVTFTLSNADGSNFRQPDFAGFSVLMGPSTMRSTQIINGQMSSSVSYTYVLQGDKPGKFTINPAKMTVSGSVVQSNSLAITVEKGSTSSQQQQSQGAGNSPRPRSSNTQVADYLKDKLFMRVSVSKRNVYQGEQLVATYKLYYKSDVQLAGIKSSKEPALSGFWKYDVDLGTGPATRESVNGVAFYSKEIKKTVLIPQQFGELTIDPLEVEYIVALPVNDGWWTTYQNFPITINSTSEKITVNKLPEPKPSDFTGAVGSLKFTSSLDKTQTKANEPVSLKVTVSGNGNLKLISPPPLNLPKDIQSFDPKQSENTSVTTSGVSGTKTFEYLLIPRREGEYKIAPLSFSYFDLNQKKYVNYQSDEYILHVEKGSGTSSSPVITGATKEDVEFIGKDILFIKTPKSSIKQESNSFWAGTSFFILAFLPVPLFIFFLIFLAKKKKDLGNRALLRNKRASSVARKHLKQSKKCLSKADEKRFYEALSRALWGYLSDKLSIPLADLTKDKAVMELQKFNLNEDIFNDYFRIIDECEFARFAPSQESQNMKNLYDQAADVISKMEASLK